MTWSPRIIQGGNQRRPGQPLRWEHADFPTALEAVGVTWWTEAGDERWGVVGLAEGQEPVRLYGTMPDELTLRELTEDVARWHAERDEDPRHSLEGAREGARYHA